jgi:malonyl-CoA O-methyltransferase
MLTTICISTGAHVTLEFGLTQASLEALPLRDRWADLTIGVLTIVHLPSLDAGLAELQRVTRPEGIIVCSDFQPVVHARGWRRKFRCGGRRYAVRHTPQEHADWQRARAEIELRIVRALEPHLEPADIATHNDPSAAPGVRWSSCSS